MERNIWTKKGFTLVEVLTVVIIIGILSAAGYAGLQRAIANSRIKDAAFNMAAFMETASNKARQLNDTVCVKKISDKLLGMYQGSCGNIADDSDEIDRLEMVVGVKIVGESTEGYDVSNLSDGADFVHRFGLSAAPAGYFLARYGSESLYGIAVKYKNKNAVVPRVSYDGSSWSDL